jgi:hypothetical protein
LSRGKRGDETHRYLPRPARREFERFRICRLGAHPLLDFSREIQLGEWLTERALEFCAQRAAVEGCRLFGTVFHDSAALHELTLDRKNRPSGRVNPSPQ